MQKGLESWELQIIGEWNKDWKLITNLRTNAKIPPKFTFPAMRGRSRSFPEW
jgi:hypothetical protein